jgi:hypothetical protein
MEITLQQFGVGLVGFGLGMLVCVALLVLTEIIK